MRKLNHVNLLKIDFFSMFHSLQTKINCTKDRNLFSIKTPLTEELFVNKKPEKSRENNSESKV